MSPLGRPQPAVPSGLVAIVGGFAAGCFGAVEGVGVSPGFTRCLEKPGVPVTLLSLTVAELSGFVAGGPGVATGGADDVAPSLRTVSGGPGRVPDGPVLGAQLSGLVTQHRQLVAQCRTVITQHRKLVALPPVRIRTQWASVCGGDAQGCCDDVRVVAGARLPQPDRLGDVDGMAQDTLQVRPPDFGDPYPHDLPITPHKALFKLAVHSGHPVGAG